MNPGEEVVIPPYWVHYPIWCWLAEGTPCPRACTLENDFKLTPEGLEEAINANTKWFMLHSPSNPRARGYSWDELKALTNVLMRTPMSG